MRDWQLQLQQEGDDCALPVETRELEILEGRYRLRIGQLSPDTSLRCRIVYRNPQEPGQPRRVHETELRSDASGSLEVFPFTYLRPGVWDLEWPEQAESGVRLQVLARDAGDDPGEPPLAIALHPEPVTAATPSDPSPDPAPQLRILLRQSRFWVQPGELFTLSGELQWLGPTSPPTHVPDMQLAVDLRQEQDWLRLHQTSPEPCHFPWNFSLPVTVPPHPEARSVQARVHLRWDGQELEECFELSLFQPEPLRQWVPDPASTPGDTPMVEPPPDADGSAEAGQEATAGTTPEASPTITSTPISFTLTPQGQSRNGRSLDLPFAPADSMLGGTAIPAAVPFPEPPPLTPAPPVPGPSFLERLQSMIEAALPEPARATETPEPTPALESPPLPQPASVPHRDEDEVPAPQLEGRSQPVPGGHLEVAVSLPLSGVRRVVKLWLQDNRQQRRLGQLRLVADFSPMDEDQAIAQLRVPLPDDLSDLSIEAVTIELPSQRESRTVHLPLV